MRTLRARALLLLLLFVLPSGLGYHLAAQVEVPAEGLGGLYRSPVPFSVNEYDVVQALWMLRRARLLIQVGPDGERTIVPVRDVAAVRAVYLGTDREAPGPQHEDRYDIVLNGEPLDWANTYIEYNNRLVNLQVLFTYRNQLPEAGLPFYLEP